MNTLGVIQSQYQAALTMLEQAISRCPNELWVDPSRSTSFWQVAYHALFFTHLYLAPSEETFQPWAKHRDEYQFLGALPWPPHRAPIINDPYTQAEVLEYLDFCSSAVNAQMEGMNLEGNSGFDWLPFTKFELCLYSLRHLQNHVGELSERLATFGNINVNWIGRGPQ